MKPPVQSRQSSMELLAWVNLALGSFGFRLRKRQLGRGMPSPVGLLSSVRTERITQLITRLQPSLLNHLQTVALEISGDREKWTFIALL